MLCVAKVQKFAVRQLIQLIVGPANRRDNEFWKAIFTAQFIIHSQHPLKPTSVRFTEWFIKNTVGCTVFLITISWLADSLKEKFLEGSVTTIEPDNIWVLPQYKARLLVSVLLWVHRSAGKAWFYSSCEWCLVDTRYMWRGRGEQVSVRWSVCWSESPHH